MNKPFVIYLKNMDGWWSAVCPQLKVSGFGASEQEAVTAVVLSIRSTLAAQAQSLQKDKRNIRKIAEIVREEVAA